MVAKGQSTEQQYATGLHSGPAYDPQQTTRNVSSGELIQWLPIYMMSFMTITKCVSSQEVIYYTELK
jgi:hypothetical protein